MKELLERLDLFPAWKLNKYTHSFADKNVLEEVYECSICINNEQGWTECEYGSTPELAIWRALELAGQKL